MQHWTASTIALTCVLLAASGLSGLNSLYRGVHRIHKHRQETFLKAKVLAMESNWSEHSHKKNEGHHCKYFDDEATDGIELRSGGGIRNESPSLFFGGSTKLFSMSNRMLGEQANTMDRKEQVLEDLQEEVFVRLEKAEGLLPDPKALSSSLKTSLKTFKDILF